MLGSHQVVKPHFETTLRPHNPSIARPLHTYGDFVDLLHSCNIRHPSGAFPIWYESQSAIVIMQTTTTTITRRLLRSGCSHSKGGSGRATACRILLKSLSSHGNSSSSRRRNSRSRSSTLSSRKGDHDHGTTTQATPTAGYTHCAAG